MKKVLVLMGLILVTGILVFAEIDRPEISDARRRGADVELTYPSNPDCYYILYRGGTLESLSLARDMSLGSVGEGAVIDLAALNTVQPQGFYTLVGISRKTPQDYDADGLDDVAELMTLSLDPLNSMDADADFDGDGLSNREELNAHSDLNQGDTDGDGLPDGWEVIYSLHPLLDGSSDPQYGPLGDPDEDGVNNLQEYQQATDPVSGYRAFTYDAYRRISKLKTRNNVVLTYTYDLLDRVMGVDASTGDSVTYAYDPVGRRTRMTDAHGTTFYHYNDFNRLTQYTISGNAIEGDADDRTIRYEYDLASRITVMTYPGGDRVEYAYDREDRMTLATNITRGVGVRYNYVDPDTGARRGLLEEEIRGNIRTLYDYNVMGWLNRVEHRTRVPNALIAEFRYDLNAMGNATNQVITRGDGTVRREVYTYDLLDRIKRVVYSDNAVIDASDTTVNYTYDEIGNRRSMIKTRNGAFVDQAYYEYDNKNRLLRIRSQPNPGGTTLASFTYDEGRNVKTRTTPSGVTTYTWDAWDRLIAVSGPGGVMQYTYNGDGQRISKTVGGVTTRYTVDPNRSVYQVLEERDANGVIAERYTYGINRLSRHTGAGNNAFYLDDRLGSVRFIAAGNGTVDALHETDIFGAGGAGSTGYGYAGEMADAETGLVYLRARYYDPTMGRFISPDPIGLAGGVNFYVYAENNPVNFVDPIGFAPQLVGVDEKGNPTYSDDIDWGRYDSKWGGVYPHSVKPNKRPFTLRDTDIHKHYWGARIISLNGLMPNFSYYLGFQFEQFEHWVSNGTAPVDPSDLWANWYGANGKPLPKGWWDWPFNEIPPRHDPPPRWSPVTGNCP